MMAWLLASEVALNRRISWRTDPGTAAEWQARQGEVVRLVLLDWVAAIASGSAFAVALLLLGYGSWSLLMLPVVGGTMLLAMMLGRRGFHRRMLWILRRSEGEEQYSAWRMIFRP